MSEFMEQNDGEKREISQDTPERLVVLLREARHIKRCDDEPGEMQVNRDARELKKTNSAASHLSHSLEITSALKRQVLLRGFRRDQQAHRDHGGLEKAMTFEKCLRFNLGAIG